MSTTEDVAGDLAGTARNTAAAVAGTVKDSGREALATVKAHAGEAASRTAEAARAEAMGRAESAKDTLADEGERLAQTLRGAVGGGDDSIQARVMGQVADSVEDLMGTIRSRSFNELLGDVDGFARRNPGAFVAAAALVGFAVARFARASTPSTDTGGYTGGYGAPQGSQGGEYGSFKHTGSGYAGGASEAAFRAAEADAPGAEMPPVEREPSGDLSQP